jgi:hypothetical protein
MRLARAVEAHRVADGDPPSSAKTTISFWVVETAGPASSRSLTPGTGDRTASVSTLETKVKAAPEETAPREQFVQVVVREVRRRLA